MKPNVIVTGTILQPALQRLEQQCTLRKWKGEERISRTELSDWLADADGWFAGGDRIDADLLKAAPRLRVISQAAVGYDNVDIRACTAHRIPVGYTPGVLVEATADLTFGLLLCAARNIASGWDFVRSGRWGERGQSMPFGVDLFDKTLGIVGMGQIGSSVARRARASGMSIAYCNRRPSPHEAELQARRLSFAELLQQSDFVLLLIPLSAETRGMISAKQLKLMKPTAYLINAARGPIVDTPALVEALQTGTIAFAALDVTDPEPLPSDHPLLSLPNVLITPHIGSATLETRTRMSELAVDNLLAGLDGKPLIECVNPEVLTP